MFSSDVAFVRTLYERAVHALVHQYAPYALSQWIKLDISNHFAKCCIVF
jgi:hypothetical protein